MTETTDTYRTEVIDPGDAVSRLAKELCFRTHRNCRALSVTPHEPGNFRGPVGRSWKPHVLAEMAKNDGDNWVMLEEEQADGAGGKPQFIALFGLPLPFGNLGWEIITMPADDFARSGRFPAVMVNEMNARRVTKENFHLVRATFEGYKYALDKACLVNTTGEVAIMKHQITSFFGGTDADLILTWGGVCIGLAHKDLLLRPSRIEPNMAVMAFREHGYRCNGGTFFTELIQELWGSDLQTIRLHSDAMRFILDLTAPSISYART